MSRLLLFPLFGLLVINISCERCKRCRYSYTETIIVETPDGEEEQIIERTDQVLLDDNGEPFGEECVKYEDYKGLDNKDDAFTIVNIYAIEAEQTTLDNFEFTCEDL